MDHGETRSLPSQKKRQRKIIDDDLLYVHDNIKKKSSTKRTIEMIRVIRDEGNMSSEYSFPLT